MRPALRYLVLALVTAPFLAGLASPAAAGVSRDDGVVSIAQVVQIVEGLPARCACLPYPDKSCRGVCWARLRHDRANRALHDHVPDNLHDRLPDNLHDRPGEAAPRPLLSAYAHVGIGTGWVSLDILAELLSIRLGLHVGLGFLTTVATTACTAASSGVSFASGSAHPGSAHAQSAGVVAGRSGARRASAVAGRPAGHPATGSHPATTPHPGSAAVTVSDTAHRPVYRMHAQAADPLRANRTPLRNLKVIVVVSIVISAGVGAIFSGTRGAAQP